MNLLAGRRPLAPPTSPVTTIAMMEAGRTARRPLFVQATSQVRRLEADGRCAPSAHPPRVRRDDAPGRVVAPARPGVRPALELHRVCHMGRVSRGALHVRAVPLPVLLAGAVWQLVTRVVRSQAGLVARLARLLAGAPDPPLPRAVP